MSTPKPVEIVGGGLAGLALGLALRNRGIPVTLFEAGEYPRHRVCGEFIAGLDDSTARVLGLPEFMEDARHHQTVAWFRGSQRAGSSRLPGVALGLSRHVLDLRLAEAFTNAGGRLLTGTRVPLDTVVPGRVIAAGRRRGPSGWIGLKAHVEHFRLGADLELHLGDGAYVGACDVAKSRTNICGLFRARPELSIGKCVTPLETYLQACGLDELAGRIAAAQLDPISHCAVAALSFARPALRDPRMLVGDAFAMIPPFTGNGMAMALQGAAMAIDPLVEWSQERIIWSTAVGNVRRRLRWRFGLRLFMAGWLHRFIHESSAQSFFAAINRAGLVPLRPLYHALH